MAKLYTREEVRRRRMKYQIFAGMFDFLALVAGLLVIVGCLILITSLINWLRADVPVTFRKVFETALKAIVIPE